MTQWSYRKHPKAWVFLCFKCTCSRAHPVLGPPSAPDAESRLRVNVSGLQMGVEPPEVLADMSSFPRSILDMLDVQDFTWSHKRNLTRQRLRHQLTVLPGNNILACEAKLSQCYLLTLFESEEEATCVDDISWSFSPLSHTTAACCFPMRSSDRDHLSLLFVVPFFLLLL